MRFSYVAALALGLIGCAPVLKKKNFGTNQIAYYTAEGGSVVRSEDGMCVVPPAAGVRQISADSAVEISGGDGNIDVGLKGSNDLVHEVTKLYDQDQNVLFLQFALYRLCEAQLNGHLSEDQYQTMFQQIITTSATLSTNQKDAAKEVAETIRRLETPPGVSGSPAQNSGAQGGGNDGDNDNNDGQ